MRIHSKIVSIQLQTKYDQVFSIFNQELTKYNHVRIEYLAYQELLKSIYILDQVFYRVDQVCHQVFLQVFAKYFTKYVPSICKDVF